ncbi:proliferating cell nuclear antigen, C-terminal domain-containing protein [Polychytrium aggregatum]|uniref:proliferating cell nuclear antigen, C-terminal domain-containing protein n=1 Tax=Polychytrium aggregatum TaxID=110093 RepID=UPI0022FF02EC|nr:proliferating cell nuclear antigen, C-terminal domain-containing protein [Polychytrium aggregatum]KAI9199498.1 proliferating cell nuclear antigen, C-terminal domain-containing protein [Polychytrium aggregatum]
MTHQLEVVFRPGSKSILVDLLSAVKDIAQFSTLSLVFTPRGLLVRFVTPYDSLLGPGCVVSFHLDAPEQDCPAQPAGTYSTHGGGVGSVPTVPSLAPQVSSSNQTVPTGASLPIPGPQRDDQESMMMMATTAMRMSHEAPLFSSSSSSSVSGLPGDLGDYPSGDLPMADPAFTGVFSSYVCQKDSMIIGIDPAVFLKQLSMVDDEDSLTIRADESDRDFVALYEMYFESPDKSRKCMYEVDAISSTGRITALQPMKYSVVCQVSSAEFSRIVHSLAETSEIVTINAGKNSITFLASGPTGTLQVGLAQKAYEERNPKLRVISCSKSAQQTVESKLLLEIAKAVPLSQHVVLHLSDDKVPIRITFPMIADILPQGSIQLRRPGMGGIGLGLNGSPYSYSSLSGSSACSLQQQQQQQQHYFYDHARSKGDHQGGHQLDAAAVALISTSQGDKWVDLSLHTPQHVIGSLYYYIPSVWEG